MSQINDPRVCHLSVEQPQHLSTACFTRRHITSSHTITYCKRILFIQSFPASVAPTERQPPHPSSPAPRSPWPARPTSSAAPVCCSQSAFKREYSFNAHPKCSFKCLKINNCIFSLCAPKHFCVVDVARLRHRHLPWLGVEAWWEAQRVQLRICGHVSFI